MKGPDSFKCLFVTSTNRRSSSMELNFDRAQSNEFKNSLLNVIITVQFSWPLTRCALFVLDPTDRGIQKNLAVVAIARAGAQAIEVLSLYGLSTRIPLQTETYSIRGGSVA